MGRAARVPGDLEGCDYSGALVGEPFQRPHSALYLNVDPAHPELGNRGLRTHEHTLAVQRRDGTENVVLYDNESDPYQLHDVSHSKPGVVQDLQRELETWLTRTGDPWVTGKVPNRLNAGGN
jgi:hypothetical protein